jgi:hypothetical protein
MRNPCANHARKDRQLFKSSPAASLRQEPIVISPADKLIGSRPAKLMASIREIGPWFFWKKVLRRTPGTELGAATGEPWQGKLNSKAKQKRPEFCSRMAGGNFSPLLRCNYTTLKPPPDRPSPRFRQASAKLPPTFRRAGFLKNCYILTH